MLAADPSVQGLVRETLYYSRFATGVPDNASHVGGLELPVDPDGQAFVGELVDEVEHAILPPFVRAVFDEVVGPDMVGSLVAQSDAGPVRKPDAALLGLFGRGF
jgi:hypothetical protein